MKIARTTAQTLIGYKKDFDPKDSTLEKKEFRIKIPNSHEEYVKVNMADGRSTELMMESFEKLDEIREQLAVLWNPRQRFRQLHSILTDDAKEAFEEIVEEDYPNDNDKTHANYKELKKKIITKLSDHVYPGDKICTYLENNVKYAYCKDEETGLLVKPTVHLKRCKLLRKYGGLMHHTHQGEYFDDPRFKTCFYGHFPQDWKDWLQDEQKMDPFDPENPLDVEEIADEMQRYWNKTIRPQVQAKKRDKRQRDDDDDDKDDKNSNQGSRKKFKKGSNNKQGGGSNNKDRSRSSHPNCSIPGHEHFRHDWTGCFLNPYNHKCDRDAAKKFYEEKARGAVAWYRDMYEQYQSRSYHNNGNTGGRGNGYQGRGSYRGRGRGGGRGYNNGGRGGRGGYHQNNYDNYGNQGDGNQQGNNGYNFSHQNGGGQQGQPQGIQQAPPQQQQSYHFGTTQGRPQAPNVPQGPPSSNYSYQTRRG